MNLRCLVGALFAMQVLRSTPAFGQAQSVHAARAVAIRDAAPPTRLIILGADHSAQLVGRRNHAGYLRVFLERLRPAVICIEQPPDGFQSFLTFDSTALARSFFFADSLAWREESRTFFNTPNAGRRDFPRRLDLYRTYLQAMRIRAAALQHPGETVLVVVGAMHKDDLERTLGDDKQLQIVQPSTAVATIDSSSAAASLASLDRFAIAAVNTLGVQALEGPVDWAWVESIVHQLSSEARGSAEARLIETRMSLLRRQIAPAAAIATYERIAADNSANITFTFTGVQDSRRVDSYFDPFGNLSVRQRAMVEAARVHTSLGNRARVDVLRATLMASASWTPLQEGELAVYWRRYVEATPTSSRSP